MTSETKTDIGKVLLVLGGAVLIGTIISEITEDWVLPGDSTSTTRKKKSTNLKDKVKKTKSRKLIVEVPNPSQNVKFSRGETPITDDRKYPDHYYTLTKAQQYKYRQRMAKELFELSQN